MSYFFADGFDCYATLNDLLAGYWDGSGGTLNWTFTAGRFAGGQAISYGSATSTLTKNSTATTDPVHHITFVFRQTAGISGTTLGLYFQLSDGATNQCCVVFRSDGALLLTSATPGGTVLDTYPDAVTASNVWFSFEIELVIHNTTGRWAVRKNGNPANDRSTTGLNTRPGANTQANKLTMGMSTSVASQIDDLMWRSDATTVPWSGDVRCYPRMPTTDASAQFARVPAGAFTQTVPTTTSGTISTNVTTARGTPFVAAYNGTVTSTSVATSTGSVGNMKCAIYADNTGVPGAVLASAVAPVAVIVGTNVFTFSPGVTITKGVQYWIVATEDNSTGFWLGQNSLFIGCTFSTTYAAFPPNNPVVATGAQPVQMSWSYTITQGNAQAVSEAQQDGTTTYVYDATPGHQDFYNLDQIATPSVQRLGLVTRGFVAKGDAGTRTGTVQLKSGASTVAAPTLNLSSSFLWSWRADTLNPATGTAWTDATANAVQAGPAVVA